MRTEEVPPMVQSAMRRLRGNHDFAVLVRWAASTHGVGVYAAPKDQRTDDFENGQRRAVTFFAEAGGVTLLLGDQQAEQSDEADNQIQ